MADAKHGPLPALLLLLTTVTGLVDAASVLSLGRVFVANMTGNIVFIGFGLDNAPGFSRAASLSALAGFLVGAVIGGGYVSRFGDHRGVLLRNTTATEFLLLLAALIVTAAAGTPLDGRLRDLVVSLAAVALGMQNVAVRRLAVPDITTTVVTMTLTAVAAETAGRGSPWNFGESSPLSRCSSAPSAVRCSSCTQASSGRSPCLWC